MRLLRFGNKAIALRNSNGVLKILADELPVNVSELVNDMNYTTKEYVDNAVNSIPRLSVEVVETLPTENINPSVIYLINTNDQENEVYEEYLYVNGKWESLGKARIDLQPYVTKEELNEILEQYTPDNIFMYSLPLGESSWLRIAKVKDIDKSASGIFTFNCYGLKEGVRDVLTTSVFSLNTCLNRSGYPMCDVLPLSQTPEIASSSASGGSGGGGGSDTGGSSGSSGEDVGSYALETVEEIETYSEGSGDDYGDSGSGDDYGDSGSGDDYGSSGGGSAGGSGTTASHGLAAITVEEYLEEMYVCGLISFPSTEKYDILEVELVIENGINVETLENFVPVNLNDVKTEENSILEGTIFEKDKEYKFIIRGNLGKLVDNATSTEPKPLNIEIEFEAEEPVEGEEPKEPEILKVINYEGEVVEEDGYSYNRTSKFIMLNKEQSVVEGGRFGEELFVLLNSYAEKTLQGLYRIHDSVISSMSYNFSEDLRKYDLNNIYLSYWDDLENFGKLKDKTNFTLKLEANGYIYGEEYRVPILLNDEEIGEIPRDENEVFSIVLENFNLEEDNLVIDATNGFINYSLYLYLDEIDYQIEIDYKPSKEEVVKYLTNDTDYDVDVFYQKLFKHYKTDSYNLFSLYKKLDKAAREASEAYGMASNAYNNASSLESKVTELHYNNLSNMSRLDQLESLSTPICMAEEIPSEDYHSSMITGDTVWFPFLKTMNKNNGYVSNLLPNDIKTVYLSEVEYIGKDSFEYLDYLTKVKLPNTLKEIAQYAFWGCNNLTFLEIPNSVEKIARNAFTSCNNLTLVIPNTIKDIGGSQDCKEIYYKGELKDLVQLDCSDGYWYSLLKNNTIYYLDDLGEIEYKNDFYTLAEFKNIIIPEGVERIGKCIFCDTDLSSISLPSTLKEIGDDAFSKCHKLTELYIPDNVEILGDIENCSELTKLNLPENLKKISLSIGNWCPKLSTNTSGNGRYLGSTTKPYWFLYKAINKNITSIEIPEYTEWIGYEAFRGCTKLTSIQLPPGLKAIGWSAFTDCEGITSIELPDSLELIEEQGLGFMSLTTLTLPSKISTIHNTAIYSPTLTDVYIKYDGIVTLMSAYYTNFPKGCRVHVKPQYVDKYNEATNWSILIAEGTITIVGDVNE